MRVFGISDLHLSMDGEKPMDKFGEHWTRHWERVEEHWRELITDDDLVLMPGDHSWALRLEDSERDFAFIRSLPGKKVLSKGNHDYWWQSLGKIRKRYPDLYFVQNDSVVFEPYAIGGTRGWNLPGADGFDDPQDEKIYKRELGRLQLALESLPEGCLRIAMLHYPPLLSASPTGFTELLEAAKVRLCVYGHMHLGGGLRPFEGEFGGVEYRLLSCDFLDFKPLLLFE